MPPVAELSADSLSLPNAARATRTRHSTATVMVHWMSAILFIVCAATIIGREYVETPSLRVFLMNAHRQAGTLLLLGLFLRLTIRMAGGMANVTRDMGFAARAAAHGCHLALYSLLFALPMLGWASTNAHNVKVTLFGITLPDLVAADSDLADTLSDYHAWTAWFMIGLVVLHAAAALFHHFVVRDHVLTAMWPGLRQRVARRSALRGMQHTA